MQIFHVLTSPSHKGYEPLQKKGKKIDFIKPSSLKTPHRAIETTPSKLPSSCTKEKHTVELQLKSTPR
jgi:hypothetical protein